MQPIDPADELLRALRNVQDGKALEAALCKVWLGHGHVALVMPPGAPAALASNLAPAELFTVLLAAAQQIGRRLGLTLAWVEDPTAKPGLVVPKGMLR